MFKVLEFLKPLTEVLGSDPALQHPLPHQSSRERGSGQQDHLLAASKELQQAWGRSLHCQLQLQTRLEILLDWAVALQQDGGTLGEIMQERQVIYLSSLLLMLQYKLSFLQFCLFVLIWSSPPFSFDAANVLQMFSTFCILVLSSIACTEGVPSISGRKH